MLKFQIKEEAEEGDQEEVYVFGSASFNLDSKKKNLRVFLT